MNGLANILFSAFTPLHVVFLGCFFNGVSNLPVCEAHHENTLATSTWVCRQPNTVVWGHVRNCLSSTQVWCLAPVISAMPSWIAVLLTGVWSGKRVNIWQQMLFCPCYFFSINMNGKLLVLIGVLGSSGTSGRNIPAQRAVLNTP